MLKQALAGVDVSAAKFDASALFDGEKREVVSFDNGPTGHKRFCSWLTRGKRKARVVVEATGIYSLDLSLALHRHPDIEVMVANPRALKNFAGASMQRSKTDPMDAASTLEYAVRMRFVPWVPPAENVLEIRVIARRISALTVERSREKNRRHALEATNTTSKFVLNDIDVNIRHLTRRIDGLINEALRIIEETPKLMTLLELLVSVKGIATTSAVQILSELLVLPADMTARQWVAHAGLDPREYQSGTSVNRPPRISKVGNKNLRRALYMPALVAIQHEEAVKNYYKRLLDRGKKPLQAIVAVMRKLLHAIFGMFKSGLAFNGEKFCRTPKVA